MALITNILVPTDFSADANRALDYAIELSFRFSAPIQIVHVYHIPVLGIPEGAILLTADIAAVIEQLQEGLARAAAHAHERGITNVKTLLREGQDWHEILAVAKELHSDLIVMGTHGRSGLQHFFLGSVAERVVRKAECPVLTVGPKATLPKP